MRVCHVTGVLSSNGGGVVEAVAGLSQAMQRGQGCEARLLGIEDRKGGTPRPIPGVRIDVLPVRGPAAFSYAPAMPAVLDEVDLVHLHGLWLYASLAATRWTSRTGRPRIISPHGMLDAWAMRRAYWKKRLALFCYEGANLRGAACLHALSRGERDAIRDFGLTNPVCVIPNGVHIPAPWTGPPPAWRAALPTDAKVLVYLGRLHPKKGLLDLLQAFAMTERDHAKQPDGWYVAIAGWDQEGHRAELESCAGAFGITHRVRFIGPQFGADKDATLNAADAFVLPSMSEGLPIAVLEAWASGLPALITPQCNLPEGEAAGAAIPIVVGAEGVATGLRRLFALSDDERRQIGARGRALVADRFTWDSVAERMVAVYAWMLGRAPAPSTVEMM